MHHAHLSLHGNLTHRFRFYTHSTRNVKHLEFLILIQIYFYKFQSRNILNSTIHKYSHHKYLNKENGFMIGKNENLSNSNIMQ